MSIRFSCPECGEPFDVPDAAAGMKGKCKCGAIIDVPRESTAATAPEPEPDVVPFEARGEQGLEVEAVQPAVAPLGSDDETEAPEVSVVDFDAPSEDDPVVEVEPDTHDDDPEPAHPSGVRAEHTEPPPPPPIAVAPSVSAPVVQPPATAPDALPVERKYGQLRAYCRMLRLSAVVAIVLAALNAAIVVWSSRVAFMLGDPLGIVAAIVFAIGIVLVGAIVSLVLRALAEFLDVVMDIEENTRSR